MKIPLTRAGLAALLLAGSIATYGFVSHSARPGSAASPAPKCQRQCSDVQLYDQQNRPLLAKDRFSNCYLNGCLELRPPGRSDTPDNSNCISPGTPENETESCRCRWIEDGPVNPPGPGLGKDATSGERRAAVARIVSQSPAAPPAR